MAIEGVQAAGVQGAGSKVPKFHADISSQIFSDVKPRTRTADAKAAEQAAKAAETAAKTEDQAATQKTDEVTTTEPSAKAKMDPKKVDEIIKNMQESVSKLGEADVDTGAVEKELAGLQEELGKYIGSYNDALKYAKSSDNLNTVQSAADMVTRTAANQEPWQQLGVKVNEDNTLEQMQSIASMKDNKEAISAMKDLFNGNYSYGAKTLESVQGIFGA
jgi:hypothetical protein